MINKGAIAFAAAVAAFGVAGVAHAASVRTKPVAVAAAPPPAAALSDPVQDCATFYDDFARRGFGWGSGPGTSVGFGAFEGALPRYPLNEFPNWYGACQNWGRYSATGTAR